MGHVTSILGVVKGHDLMHLHTKNCHCRHFSSRDLAVDADVDTEGTPIVPLYFVEAK